MEKVTLIKKHSNTDKILLKWEYITTYKDYSVTVLTLRLGRRSTLKLIGLVFDPKATANMRPLAMDRKRLLH